jgi:hypothetical protein
MSLTISFRTEFEDLTCLREYFLNVHILSLLFYDALNLDIFHELTVLCSISITRLEIRCPMMVNRTNDWGASNFIEEELRKLQPRFIFRIEGFSLLSKEIL